MHIIHNQRFSIYFGDASYSLSRDEIVQKKYTPVLQNVSEQMNLSQLVFLEQVHGVDGDIVNSIDDSNQLFLQIGDYLITQKKDCGIGVVTADCLPIILYDPDHHVAAVVHAGWKGLLAGIVQVASHKMIEVYKSSMDNLQVYIGPAARPCCYEVQADFVDLFFKNSNIEEAFLEKNGKISFDSTVFTLVLARNLGINAKNIYTTYNVCTICDTSFCSYRREKEKARRQITLISLH